MADEKENPSVARRVISTAAKAVGKGLEKIPEFNEYLDKKYGENVPEGKVSDSVRKALFGDDPKKATERGKKTTEALGKDSYFKKGGKVKKYATGGLTPAERKAMLDEKVAPPRGTTKKEADIFKPGMKPPVDDDMGSAKPVKRAKGGMAKSASARADGCCVRGKTRA